MNKLLSINVLSVFGLLFSSSVIAQESDSGALEEIIVTAEKRESTLQDTAVSIAAYQGDLLQDLDINDVQALIL